jgi:hypothetical protein
MVEAPPCETAVVPPPKAGAIVLSARFDELEAKMAAQPQIRLPLNHIFTPGLYIREVLLPKGTLLTSKIHMLEHPFVISHGRVRVWSGIDGEESQELGAPYTGITKPGTRRIIYAYEDTIWTTFHVTNETDIRKIERDIIFRHDEHLPFSVTADGVAVEKLMAPTQHANA